MKPITIFTGASGLNTVTDPVRIPFKGGISDLQVAVNVSIDQSGRVARRTGVSLLQSGDFHSLFCNGGDCFVIKNDSLFKVADDGTLTGIRSGLTADQRMAFVQEGDRTYYSNGYELGWIEDGISHFWDKGTYTGVDTNSFFSYPMPGSHLATFSGRIFVSVDNILWWSELYDFGLFNMAKSFIQFHSKIIMIKPVTAGVFISTKKNTYFLLGVNPQTWQIKRLTGYPAIEWTDSIEYINGVDLGMENNGMYPIWASPEGTILGTPEGQIINLNKNKVIYPDNPKAGFGCVVGMDFIHGME